MKNLPLKKIASALAFAVAVVILSTLLADLLYRPKMVVKRGYEIEIAAKGSAVKKVEVKLDIASLIKNANIDMGAKTFKKCAACHSVDNGGSNKIGPNLFGIVNRKKAAIAGFAYSQAMKNKGGSWSYEELNQLLASPKNFVPGTKMTFAGLKKDQDRANVIAYLEKNTKSK